MSDSRGSAGRLEGMTVLVVDDAPYLREALVLLLEAEGATVVATGSGREALDLARRQAFELIVTDLGLPDLAGEFLVRELAATPERPRVVVITGADDDESHLVAAGAARVFAKPLEWSALLDGLVALSGAPEPGREQR